MEGIEPPEEDDGSEPIAEQPLVPNGGLPFGFQGESTVYTSRLPFGIGSFAEGIPFEGGMATSAAPRDSGQPPPSSLPAESLPSSENPVAREVSTTPDEPDTVLSHANLDSPVHPESTVQPEPAIELQPPVESEPLPSLPDVEEIQPATTAPPSAPAFEPPSQATPVRLETARLVHPSPVDGAAMPASTEPTPPVNDEPTVHDYWRIDAQIPNYEEIYDHTEEVVEVEYGSLAEDVVVFDHETDSPAAVFHSPLEASPVSVAAPSMALSLHPAQALGVDVGGSPDLQDIVEQGFGFMQQGSWSQSARAFQRLAASLPTSPEVFNNYGISLLQRAISMRDGPDLQQRPLADAQFESAILALREAAKGAPTNGDILVNLAIALIESGRSEKALGIMNVHNAREQRSAKGMNTAAVAMFNLGQLSQAAATLQKVVNDPVASTNLQKLSPAAKA